jgi:acyl-CoA synthetase (AMP-forming)/AMP-acid ligase II
VDQGTLFDSIRQAVVVSHGLSVHQILLVKSGTIPTTSSGKIQRVLCREHFLQGALQPQLIGASPATA